MTHTSKALFIFIINLISCNGTLFCYPTLGTFYKSAEGHSLLLLVDEKSADNKQEILFKQDTITHLKKLLFDNEINIILEAQLEKVSSEIKTLISYWDKELGNNTELPLIVEQNYSSSIPPAIAYKKMTLAPLEATKLYILLSRMKDYIHNLPLKEHLNFSQKIGSNKENNLFKSCQYARDYFALKNESSSATITLTDWQTPAIARITNYYKSGLLALAKSTTNDMLNRDLWPNNIEKVVKAFVPHDFSSEEFLSSDTLKIKDLLDEIALVLKRLDKLEQVSSTEYEKILWELYKTKLQRVRQYFLNSLAIFQSLPEEDKKNFERIFKFLPKYQYTQLHWFGFMYSYIFKSKNPTNIIYPEQNEEWLSILTEDLLIIGIIEAIVDSRLKHSKAVLYLNKDTYLHIAHYLESAGYAKIATFDHLNTGNALTVEELNALLSQFPINVQRIKYLLQQPIACSILM